MRRKLNIFLILLFACACSGCSDQQILEDTSIIIYTGVEAIPEGEQKDDIAMLEQTDDTRLFTFAIAGEKEDKGILRFLQAEDSLMSNAIDRANQAVGLPLKDGKMQNIIISKDLAATGLRELTDNNKISSINRFLPDYLISDIPPSELLQTLSDMDIGKDAFSYISDLVKNSAETGICPNPQRRKASLRVLNKYIDATVPMITAINGEIMISGTALFQDDKYVGYLNTVDSRYLNFMVNDYKDSIISLPFKNDAPGEDEVSYYITSSTRDMHISVVDNHVEVLIDVGMHGYIDEMNWRLIREQYDVNQFSTAATRHIQKHMTRVLEQTQALGVDPFGIQEYLRAHHNEFLENHNFRNLLKDANITTQIDVFLTNDTYAT